jgi:benzaldehyde dehydrogenase (NAD)
VILKASESCPATHRLIGSVLREAGPGDGVVNVVTNAPTDAPAIVEALIGHSAVRRVNFTGSTRVGRIVAEMAARQLKPAVFELGGKAPLVILKDADLDQAVNAAAFGAFANSGQICMSTDRIIVDKAIADEFVAKFVAKVKGPPCGDPAEGEVVLASVISRQAANHVRRLIEAAVAKGAKLVLDGTTRGTHFARRYCRPCHARHGNVPRGIVRALGFHYAGGWRGGGDPARQRHRIRLVRRRAQPGHCAGD